MTHKTHETHRRRKFMDYKVVKIEIYIPEEYIVTLRDELTKINACKVGNYDHVVSFTEVKGYWKPLSGRNPFNGEIDEISSGCEYKMEVRCPIENVSQAIEVIKKYHPYEEPLINIIPLLNDSYGLS